jgi:hypothetical protein
MKAGSALSDTRRVQPVSLAAFGGAIPWGDPNHEFVQHPLLLSL